MRGVSKGFVLPSELVNIIFTALVVMMIIMVFYFVGSRFGGGQYCLSRFQGKIAELVHEAATTYGSGSTYTSLKMEDCVKDAYFKEESTTDPETGVTTYVPSYEYCYTYREDGKEKCDKTVAFQQTGSTVPTNVEFKNCGSNVRTGDPKLQSGTYTVKITMNTVCCRGC